MQAFDQPIARGDCIITFSFFLFYFLLGAAGSPQRGEWRAAEVILPNHMSILNAVGKAFASVVAAILLNIFCACPVAWASESGGERNPQIQTSQVEFPEPIIRVGVSADGNLVAAADATKTVYVKDISTGKFIAQFKHDGYQCERVKFSDHNAKLFLQIGTGLLNSRRRFELWDLKGQQRLFPMPPRLGEARQDDPLVKAWCADMSPNGEHVAFAGPLLDGIYILNVNRSAVVHRQAPANLPMIGEIQYVSDGKWVACVGEANDDTHAARMIWLQADDFVVGDSQSLDSWRFCGLASGRSAIVGRAAHKDDLLELSYLAKGSRVLASDMRFDDVQDTACLSDGRVAVLLNSLVVIHHFGARMDNNHNK